VLSVKKDKEKLLKEFQPSSGMFNLIVSMTINSMTVHLMRISHPGCQQKSVANFMDFFVFKFGQTYILKIQIS
jgi:hypothetical protein